MTDKNTGVEVNGGGNPQDGRDTRSPWRIGLDASYRFVIFTMILFIIVAVPSVVAWLAYAFALAHHQERWLVMVASVVTGGLIAQLGLRFVRSLLVGMWVTLKGCFVPNPATFWKRLYGLKTHGIPLFSIVFISLVFLMHAKTDISLPGLINAEVTRAMTVQGYTRERAVLLDRLAADYYFARFPITFERAELTKDISEHEFGAGVEYIADSNGDLVRRLVKALVPCGTVDKPVYLKVEGYASSEPFKNQETGELIESNKLNVRVANERRRNVEDALRKAINNSQVTEGGIVVTDVADHNDLAEMERDREFNDRPDEGDTGNGRFEQDFLTRAAHIKVLSPGNCAVH